MTLPKAKQAELAAEREHALGVLRGMLRRGDEVGTVTIHGRGMADYVECFVGRGQRVERVTYYVARATGLTLTERGIQRGGGNYDKAYDVVDSLSRAMFGEGNQLTRNRMLG